MSWTTFKNSKDALFNVLRDIEEMGQQGLFAYHLGTRADADIEEAISKLFEYAYSLERMTKGN